MANVSTFTDGQPYVQLDAGQVGVIENYIDFSETSASSGDVVYALRVKDGTWVHSYQQRIVAAEGATCTIDVGDGDDPNGFDDTVNCNNTVGTITKSLEATDAYGIGRYYSSDDTIDFTLNHDTDTAEIYCAVIAWWPRCMSGQNG